MIIRPNPNSPPRVPQRTKFSRFLTSVTGLIIEKVSYAMTINKIPPHLTAIKGAHERVKRGRDWLDLLPPLPLLTFL